jgi:hypothetical protein
MKKVLIIIAIILAVGLVYFCCAGLAQAEEFPICFATTPDAWGNVVQVCMTEAEAVRLGIITPMPTLDAYPGLETPAPAAYPGLDVFSGGEDVQPTRMVIRDNRRERQR